MSIIVYGKPLCPECERTKEELANHKIEYTYVDLSLEENLKDLNKIKNLGFRSVPVIIEDGEPVSLGFLIN